MAAEIPAERSVGDAILRGISRRSRTVPFSRCIFRRTAIANVIEATVSSISHFSFLISHYLFRLGTRPSTIADLAGA